MQDSKTGGSSLRGMAAKVRVKFSLELSGLHKILNISPLFGFIPKLGFSFFFYCIKNDVLKS